MGTEAGGLIDRADVEHLIEHARFNRVQYMRNNIRRVIWTAGSIAAACALALAGLSLSSTPKAPAAHHVSYLNNAVAAPRLQNPESI